MAYSVSYTGSSMDTILAKALNFEDKNEAWAIIPSSITTLDISKVRHKGNYVYTGTLSLPSMDQLYGFKNTTSQVATTINCTCMIFVRYINHTIYQFISTRGIQDNADKTMGIVWINSTPKVFFLSEESNSMMAMVAGESADKGIHKFNNQIRVFKDTKMIKYYDQISNSYKQFIMDMMPKSIYGNVNSFFSFVDINVTQKYAKFKTHTQDSNTHITSANKTTYDSKYRSDLLESDVDTWKATFLSEFNAQVNNLKNTITTIQNKVSNYATTLSNHSNNTTLHPTQSQIDDWDSKKEKDHTHTTNEITIDAANVTGKFTVDQIPDTAKAKERLTVVSSYADMMNLTESNVQDGDWVYINDAEYPLAFVVDSSRQEFVEHSVTGVSSIYQVVCGNGTFVAVAKDSKYFVYSKDGINWVRTTASSMARDWRTICFGNGKFVAPAANSTVFVYSTDGINWTEGTISSTARIWRSICYGMDKFVMVSKDSAYFAYSSDGINWTEDDIGTIDREWRCVCYGMNLFIAVVLSSNYFAYSTDGINWSLITVGSTSRSWRSVCFGNGMFVAVADSTNTYAYSYDGINWTENTLVSYRKWTSICYGNHMFFITCESGHYYEYSIDGINWTEVSFSDTNRRWYSSCYGLGLFVAVSSDTPYTAYGSISRFVQLTPDKPDLYWGDVLSKPNTYEGLGITDDMPNSEVDSLQSDLNTKATAVQSSLDTLTQNMSTYIDDRVKSTHILETSIDITDQKLSALYNVISIPEKIVSTLEQVLV